MSSHSTRRQASVLSSLTVLGVHMPISTLATLLALLCHAAIHVVLATLYMSYRLISLVNHYTDQLRLQGLSVTVWWHRMLFATYSIFLLCAMFLTPVLLAAAVMLKMDTPTWRRWTCIAASACIMVGFVFWLGEGEIVASMHVHILDPDMVNTAGLMLTIQRQITLLVLGKWLPHWIMVKLHWILMALLAMEIGLFRLSSCVAHRILALRRRRFIVGLFMLLVTVMVGCFIIFFAGVTSLPPDSPRRSELLNWLPMNVWLNNIFRVGDFIPVTPVLAPVGLVLSQVHAQTNALSRPAFNRSHLLHAVQHDNPAIFSNPYPVFDEGGPCGKDSAKAPEVQLKHKPNVFILTQETWPKRWWTPENAPLLNSFIHDPSNRCFTTDQHLSMSTVTEMAHFALIYGLHPSHLLAFSRDYVRSFPMCLMRRNGYLTSYWSSSGPYQFPSDVLLNGNFQDHMQSSGVHEQDNNDEPLSHTYAFMRQRAEDRVPFLVQFHFHQHALRLGTQEHEIRNDIDRDTLLKTARSQGQLDGSVVIITGDHGDRDTHFGDGWLMSKLDLPFYVCLPQNSDAPKPEGAWPQRIPGVSSHMDVMPTVLQMLQPEPAIPPQMYSHGLALPLPGSAAPPLPENRVHFGTPRWFPQQNRISVLVDSTEHRNLLFRVEKHGTDARNLTVVPLYLRDFQDNELANYVQRNAKDRVPKILLDALPAFSSDQIMWRFMRPE